MGIIAIEMPSAYAADAQDYLSKGLAARDNLKGEPLLSFCIAPHAPYTVSDRTFRDGPHPATVLIDPTPLEYWRSQHFDQVELADGNQEGSLWGDLADPDRDGRPNLVEYALGTQPRRGDASGLTATSSADSLTFSYNRDTRKTDITYEPEASSDLADWGKVASELVSTDGTIETRRVMIPTTAGSGHYLRLRIARSPEAAPLEP